MVDFSPFLLVFNYTYLLVLVDLPNKTNRLLTNGSESTIFGFKLTGWYCNWP